MSPNGICGASQRVRCVQEDGLKAHRVNDRNHDDVDDDDDRGDIIKPLKRVEWIA